MTERATRFPCPVCLSVMMDTVVIGEGETALEIDHCTRCGGVRASLDMRTGRL